MSSALAGCSSVEHQSKMASVQQSSADGQSAVQYSSALPVDQAQSSQAIGTAAPSAGQQPTVVVAKTARLPVPVPPATEAASVQTVAMASPTMPAVVPFKPQPIAAAVQPPALSTTQPLTQVAATASAQGRPTQAQVQVASLSSAPALPSSFFPPVPAAPGSAPSGTASPKSGRLVSPPVAAAVAAGQISPAAAQAIALDEQQPTPDMVALQAVVPVQSVVPIPRPDTNTLAYAAQPKTVAAVSAIDQRMEFPPAPGDPIPSTASGATPELVRLIKRYAGLYGVPESLVHRVVHRESKYDPKAYHKNGYWGLMQIKYATAKSMGYSGPPEGLLDAETNLKYAIKYLRGAWLVADNQNDNAIKLYARGYYNDAKRKDMLQVLEK
jgi:soluble lytic murein transglycosylase-like protein